jgi:hypothetical protein
MFKVFGEAGEYCGEGGEYCGEGGEYCGEGGEYVGEVGAIRSSRASLNVIQGPSDPRFNLTSSFMYPFNVHSSRFFHG